MRYTDPDGREIFSFSVISEKTFRKNEYVGKNFQKQIKVTREITTEKYYSTNEKLLERFKDKNSLPGIIFCEDDINSEIIPENYDSLLEGNIIIKTEQKITYTEYISMPSTKQEKQEKEALTNIFILDKNGNLIESINVLKQSEEL